MIRRVLADVGRRIDGLIRPAPQVQFGVAGAVDEQEQREVDDLIASFGFPPGFLSSVSAAGVAAETSPEAVSTVLPAVPASGQPDPVDQIEHVRALIHDHNIQVVIGNNVQCRCGWRVNGTGTAPYVAHTHHVGRLVAAMLHTDIALAQATNKFRN